MARTGRFGRLPTQSPDLSSQIVSMMEQYNAAQDRNILDAWQNGGTYQGKKVTDKDIIAYYKKRRGEYDKDEPEYDQWNQDLWQLKYQIADEKIQSKYRQGKIGPKAVANHYKRWAKRMPKNSSFYRNLMAAYGDYMKAAAVGKGGGSGSGGGSSGANAYARLQNRIKQLDKEQRPASEFLDLLSEYARRKGYIPADASITDPGVWDSYEAADFQLMLEGVQDWDEYKAWAKGQRRQGYTTFNDPDGFQRKDVMDAITLFITKEKAKIKAYKQYPGDMSSYIQESKNNIRMAQGIRRQVKPGGLIDTKADWNDAWVDFLGEPGDEDGVGLHNNDSPTDAVKDIDGLLKATRKTKRKADLNGDRPTALFMEVLEMALTAARDGTATDPAVQQAVTERMAYIQNQFPDLATDFAGNLFVQPGSMSAFSQELAVHFNGGRMLRDGTGVKVPYTMQPTKGEQALGDIAGPGYRVWSMERDPSGQIIARDPESDEVIYVGEDTAIVSEVRKDSSGKTYLEPVLIAAKPIINEESGQQVGVVWEHDGQRVWGRPDPDRNGLYLNTTFDIFTEAGANLTYRGDTVLITYPDSVDPLSQEQVDEFFRGPRSMADLSVALQANIESTVDAPVEGETPEQTEARLVGKQDVLDALASGDPDALLDNPEAVREAYAYLQIDEELVVPYEGTGMEDEARRAVLAEALRQNGMDIEYDPAQSVFITASGRMRDPADAMLYSGQGGDEFAVSTRQRIMAEAAERGVPYSVALSEYAASSSGGAFDSGGGIADITSRWTDTPTVSSVGTEGSSFGEWASVGDGQDVVEQQGLQEGFFTYVDGLADAGTNSVEVAFIIANPEKRELLHQNPDLFLDVVVLSAKDPAQAEAFLRDINVVMTENGLDDQLKPLATKGAIREVSQGFAIALVNAQARVEEAMGVRFEGQSDLYGGGFNVFQGDPEAPAPGQYAFPSAVGVRRASETQVEVHETPEAEQVQPDITLPAPLAQIAGTVVKGVTKVAANVNTALSKTYIAQTASAPSIEQSAAAIAPIKPVSVNTSNIGVKVNIPNVEVARTEVVNTELPKGYTYNPPPPPPAPDIDTALGQIT